MKDGFIKVAAASPVIKVADCEYNAERVIDCIREAEEKGVKVLVFPELTLTGASCWDLFRHRVILDGAEKALVRVVEASAGTDVLAFVGLPLAVGPRVYSVAAVLWDGELIAFVPRRTASCNFNGSGDGDYHEIELDSFSRYVVLSTCAYSFHNARTVLHGKLTPVPSTGGRPNEGYK